MGRNNNFIFLDDNRFFFFDELLNNFLKFFQRTSINIRLNFEFGIEEVYELFCIIIFL